MSYNQAKSAFDGETQIILDIASKFLCDYFGHTPTEAERLVSELIETYPDMYDEDFIHRESSYGVAAGAHYLCALMGERARLRDWRIETGHNKTPSDALDYFRRMYFAR